MTTREEMMAQMKAQLAAEQQMHQEQMFKQPLYSRLTPGLFIIIVATLLLELMPQVFF
jgi:hypothetical protein